MKKKMIFKNPLLLLPKIINFFVLFQTSGTYTDRAVPGRTERLPNIFQCPFIYDDWKIRIDWFPPKSFSRNREKRKRWPKYCYSHIFGVGSKSRFRLRDNKGIDMKLNYTVIFF